MIINRIKPDMVRRGEMFSVDDVLGLLAIELVGLIPEDEYIVTSTNRGMPVAMNGKSPAGQAFCNVALRLQGEKVPFRELDGHGFFGRLSRLIRSGGG